jgi:hypothetical protein
MSRIIWSDALTPGEDAAVEAYAPELYGGAIRVERAKALPIEESQAKLPDRRVHRSMSRAGVLLSLVCLKSKEIIDQYLEKDPYSVGIYCAIENGPVNFASARAMMDVARDDFGDMYKKLHNPKMYLRQLPNLAAAQMGIFLNILGPMNVYNHSTHGSLHALEQAEIDLADNRVAAALVCSASSFENPLIVERQRRAHLGTRVFCEGAGAMLLVADGSETDWKSEDYLDTEEFFGISHQIIIQVKRRRSTDEYGTRSVCQSGAGSSQGLEYGQRRSPDGNHVQSGPQC